MKRYRFRLDPVLRVRRIQEDVARGALARADAELAAAGAALGAAREWLAELDRRPLPGEPASWTARRTLVLRAADEIDARVADVDAAAAARHQRQAELRDARRRVRALERLDERRRAEHQLEADRQEDRVVDDLVTSRFRAAAAEAPA